MASAGLDAGRAVIDLVLNTSQLEKALKDSKSSLETFARSFETVGRAFTAAGGGIIATLTAVALKSASVGDNIAKAANRLGIATSEFAALGHAAVQSGTSVEELENAIKVMQKEAASAVPATELLGGLKTFGLTFEQFGQLVKQPTKLIRLLGDRLVALEDAGHGAEARGSIQKISRRLQRFIPLLRGGSGAIDAFVAQFEHLAGETFSEAFTKIAEDIVDAMGEMKLAFKAVGLQALKDIGAGVAAVIRNFAEGAVSIRMFLSQTEGIVQATAVVGGALFALGTVVVGLSTAFLGLSASIALVGGSATAIAIIPAAIVGAFGAAAAAMTLITKSGREAAAGLFEAFTGNIGHIIGFIQRGDLEGAWEATLNGLEEITLRAYVGMVRTLIEFTNMIPSIIERVAIGIGQLVTRAFSLVERNIIDALAGLLKYIRSVFEAIETVLNLLDKLPLAFKVKFDLVPDKLESAIRSLEMASADLKKFGTTGGSLFDFARIDKRIAELKALRTSETDEAKKKKEDEQQQDQAAEKIKKAIEEGFREPVIGAIAAAAKFRGSPSETITRTTGTDALAGKKGFKELTEATDKLTEAVDESTEEYKKASAELKSFAAKIFSGIDREKDIDRIIAATPDVTGPSRAALFPPQVFDPRDKPEDVFGPFGGDGGDLMEGLMNATSAIDLQRLQETSRMTAANTETQKLLEEQLVDLASEQLIVMKDLRDGEGLTFT